VSQRRSAVWWLQVYGWTVYGLSVYLAMLPALRPGQWIPMLGVKVLRTALGLGSSVVLMRVYRMVAGRSLATHVATTLAASLILGAAWLVSFEVALATATGKGLVSVDWSAVPREVIDYAFVLLAWSGAYFGIQFWRSAENERRRAASARARVTEVELQSLRYQLNPHFLFNALNSIRASVPTDAPVARQLISDFSRFLRHTLQSSGFATVPLSDECASIASYLAIERRRFEDRLCVDVTVDPAVGDTPVPCFLLHPLVENAIKHGLPGRTAPMELHVSAVAVDGGVLVEVANIGQLSRDGTSLSQPEGMGIGLRNVRARLERAYRGHASIALVQDGPWVRARIAIPSRTGELTSALMSVN
jgi:hypothetical protein